MLADERYPLSSRPVDERTSFTSLEWLVIAIGARDGSTPLQWTPFGRLLLHLMGREPQRLASPCLETLRHAASVVRHHGWTLPASEIGAFLRGGWSEAQLERLIESAGPDHDRHAHPTALLPSIEPRIAPVA